MIKQCYVLHLIRVASPVVFRATAFSFVIQFALLTSVADI